MLLIRVQQTFSVKGQTKIPNILRFGSHTVSGETAMVAQKQPQPIPKQMGMAVFL